MPLPDGFPAKAKLEEAGYDTVQDVREASDEELLGLDGIAEGTLAKIRESAPFQTSSAEEGTGETSGVPSKDDPANQSVLIQTSKPAKNQVNPVTGEDLPKGITINERGTLTATSEAPDSVTPKQIEAERKNLLTNARNRLQAIFGE